MQHQILKLSEAKNKALYKALIDPSLGNHFRPLEPKQLNEDHHIIVFGVCDPNKFENVLKKLGKLNNPDKQLLFLDRNLSEEEAQQIADKTGNKVIFLRSVSECAFEIQGDKISCSSSTLKEKSRPFLCARPYQKSIKPYAQTYEIPHDTGFGFYVDPDPTRMACAMSTPLATPISSLRRSAEQIFSPRTPTIAENNPTRIRRPFPNP